MINAQDYHDTVKIGAFDDSYQAVQTAVQAYIEGLHWVLQSYYVDVPSWEWHYPFQHAPMTSDFVRLKRINIRFTQGTPLKPLQQLLAVLPRTSYWLLPPAYQVNVPHCCQISMFCAGIRTEQNKLISGMLSEHESGCFSLSMSEHLEHCLGTYLWGDVVSMWIPGSISFWSPSLYSASAGAPHFDNRDVQQVQWYSSEVDIFWYTQADVVAKPGLAIS